jgi:hypothetical protein
MTSKLPGALAGFRVVVICPYWIKKEKTPGPHRGGVGSYHKLFPPYSYCRAFFVRARQRHA